MSDLKNGCQATFKDYCQWPHCDCDRIAKCVVTAEKIMSTEFPRLKRIKNRGNYEDRIKNNE